VLTAEDLSETVSATARDAMKLARIVTWYALGAGLCVLIAAISASQASRLQEIGILSAVGARPRVIRAIYTIEFAAIGAVSGIIAALLACGFASVVTSIIAGHLDLALDWKASLAAISAAIVLTVAGGWLPVYDLLKRRPLEALRELR
jgi:putative ABC transport system permease protein